MGFKNEIMQMRIVHAGSSMPLLLKFSKTPKIAYLSILCLSACFAGKNVLAQMNAADGWASVNEPGQNGTTGGANGDVVVATNTTEFLTYILKADPYIIHVNGTINLAGMISMQSNKTVVGVDSNGIIRGGGLNISGKSNIIIRNLLFEGSVDDAINVQESSHHIWIDHCDFTNAYDGAVDIKRGSDFVTVSWNRFYNHDKTSLLGHSDNNGAQDIGHLRVTYHHNWYDHTVQRHPRVRFSALCHVYNNYFIGNNYGVGSAMDAEVLVEYNYFKNVKDPTLVGVGASGPGDLVERNNIFDNCTNPAQTRGTVPEPPYSYAPDSAAAIPAMLEAGAGRIGYNPATSIADDAKNAVLKSFELVQNYPNPFNPKTTIQFQLPEPEHVRLTIYNLSGQELAVLLDERLTVGTHRIAFDAGHLSSGLYLYQLRAGHFTRVKKMLFTK